MTSLETKSETPADKIAEFFTAYGCGKYMDIPEQVGDDWSHYDIEEFVHLARKLQTDLTAALALTNINVEAELLKAREQLTAANHRADEAERNAAIYRPYMDMNDEAFKACEPMFPYTNQSLTSCIKIIKEQRDLANATLAGLKDRFNKLKAARLEYHEAKEDWESCRCEATESHMNRASILLAEADDALDDFLSTQSQDAEELVKDKQRLDWLNETGMVCTPDKIWDKTDNISLRQAIDAAIGQTKGLK